MGSGGKVEKSRDKCGGVWRITLLSMEEVVCKGDNFIFFVIFLVSFLPRGLDLVQV